MERFEDWEKAHTDEVGEMKKVLSEPLSDDGEILWGQLRDIEKFYGRCQFLLAVADAYLDIAEAERIPKSKVMTSLEKQVDIKASCVPERTFRDYVKGILSAIEKRLSLGQSRMRYLRDLYVSSPIQSRREN